MNNVGDILAPALEQPLGSNALARPKSSTFTVPSVRTLMLGWFEIPVDDPLLVRRFERFGDLLRDRQGFVGRDGSLRDAIRQRRPSTSSRNLNCCNKNRLSIRHTHARRYGSGWRGLLESA
jgi:hypothetical protein